MNCSRTFEQQTYGNYLQSAGYTTAYFGKYLNPPAMDPFCHNKSTPIPGWDEMLGMCVTAYFDIPWVDSYGHIVKTGSSPDEYSTSIIGNRTVRFIEQHVRRVGWRGESNGGVLARPFFVSAATRAPHKPYTPAPWYEQHSFPGGALALRTPAWNSTGRAAQNHVDWLTSNGPISAKEERGFDESNLKRWRTLLSVDDLVEAVVATLSKTGLLNSTYLFYSSDNGYHLGHLRLPDGKSHFYEFDARVPFLVRGPRVAAGSTPATIAGNVDLAPTFLALAGLDARDVAPLMDGRSVLPWLLQLDAEVSAGGSHAQGGRGARGLSETTDSSWRSAFLLEFSGLRNWPKAGSRINDSPNNTWRALRIVEPTTDWLYAEWTTVADYDYDHVRWYELYDLVSDPYQLDNRYYTKTDEPTKRALAKRLLGQWKCAGEKCD